MTENWRIGVIGLQTTHAFSDARNLMKLAPRSELAFYDRDPERCRQFVREWPTARLLLTPEEVLAWSPHGVIITERPAATSSAVRMALLRGVPVFVNKPAVISSEQLRALDHAVAHAPERFLTTSVLRFAPTITQTSRVPMASSDLEIVIRHNVHWWTGSPSRWQDDPGEGGGIVAAMGVHAFEMAAAIFGPEFIVTGAEKSCRFHPELDSDFARVDLAWAGGARCRVTLIGDWGDEEYRVLVDGESVAALPAGNADTLGYLATIRHFVAMMGGKPSPVTWPEMRRVLQAVVDATLLASRAG